MNTHLNVRRCRSKSLNVEYIEFKDGYKLKIPSEVLATRALLKKFSNEGLFVYN